MEHGSSFSEFVAQGPPLEFGPSIFGQVTARGLLKDTTEALGEGQTIPEVNSLLVAQVADMLERKVIPSLAFLQEYWCSLQSSVQLVAVSPAEWSPDPGLESIDVVAKCPQPYWLAVLYHDAHVHEHTPLLWQLAACHSENIRRLNGKTGLLHIAQAYSLPPLPADPRAMAQWN